MRIIGGSARGRRLFAPPGENTRPTADRVREALFNILAARLDGARVLDLFGGSGALALEALSRGAAWAVIGDKNPGAVNVIRRNALSVLGEGKEVRNLPGIMESDRAYPDVKHTEEYEWLYKKYIGIHGQLEKIYKNVL